MTSKDYQTPFWVPVFSLGLAMIVMAYYPSLNSFFLIDDVPNLQGLKTISAWFDQHFWQFTFGGIAGPTGRPISLFSFALQYQDWPEGAMPLKAVNLFIHLLNACLLIRIMMTITAPLIKSISPPPSHTMLACSIALIWVVHPVHVNTVLYLVQRMVILSAFFTLLSITCFIHANKQWSTNRKAAIVYFVLATIIFPFMATFSKENGALTYFYLALIYWFTIKVSSAQETNSIHIPKNIVHLFIHLPCFAILCYLIFGFFHWYPAYEFRNFTLIERVLTQSRVLWEYILSISYASPSQFSLLGHDSYPISRSLFQPATTIISIAAWFLIALAFRTHIKQTKLCIYLVFGTLWFLLSHILESTILPLEIYFDHRNYLASAGIIFLIVLGIAKFSLSIKGREKTAFSFMILFLISYYLIISKSNISLWEHRALMGNAAVLEYPQSIRAHHFRLITAALIRDADQFEAAYKDSKKTLGFNSLLELTKLSEDCKMYGKTTLDENWLADFQSVHLNENAAKKIDAIYTKYNNQECHGLDEDFFYQLFKIVEMTAKDHRSVGGIHYLLAFYYFKRNDLDNFEFHFSKSMEADPQPDRYLLGANFFLNRHNFKRAFDYIYRAEQSITKTKIIYPKINESIQQWKHSVQTKRDQWAHQ